VDGIREEKSPAPRTVFLFAADTIRSRQQFESTERSVVVIEVYDTYRSTLQIPQSGSSKALVV
jgi:hypothetical protein